MNSNRGRLNDRSVAQVLLDIQKHSDSKCKWTEALQTLNPVKDFSMAAPGCSAEQAIKACNHLKEFLPASAPPDASGNIDQIIREIRRVDEANRPGVVKILLRLLVFAAVIALTVYLAIVTAERGTTNRAPEPAVPLGPVR